MEQAYSSNALYLPNLLDLKFLDDEVKMIKHNIVLALSLIRQVIFLLILLFSTLSYSQNSNKALPKAEFRVSLDAVMYQKLQTIDGDSEMIKFKDSPSAILNLSNLYRLKHGFALEPNIGFTVISYRYKYDIEIPDTHPLNNGNYDYGNRLSDKAIDPSLYSVRLGLSLHKEQAIKNNQYLSFGVGVNYNLYPTYSLSSGHTYQLDTARSYRVAYTDLEGGGTQSWLFGNLTYSTKIGWAKYNEKGHSYGFAFVAAIQPKNIGIGTYLAGYESGNLIWKNGYYGISFTKSFSKDTNSKVKRLGKKQP